MFSDGRIAYKIRINKVGDPDKPYAYPEEILDFLRAVYDKNIKADIVEGTNKISLSKFAQIIMRPN